MTKGLVNWDWFDGRLESLKIPLRNLKKYHFHPETVKGWDRGQRPRPHTFRKLARILQVTPEELERNLGVSPATQEA